MVCVIYRVGVNACIAGTVRPYLGVKDDLALVVAKGDLLIGEGIGRGLRLPPGCCLMLLAGKADLPCMEATAAAWFRMVVRLIAAKLNFKLCFAVEIGPELGRDNDARRESPVALFPVPEFASHSITHFVTRFVTS